MSQHTDDMMDGICCSLCGMFFVNPDKPEELYEHGYPVVCGDCWQEMPKRNRRDYQRATAPRADRARKQAAK